MSIPCRNQHDHTPKPEGYLQWFEWAAKMNKTHAQRRCPACGKYEIWEPRL